MNADPHGDDRADDTVAAAFGAFRSEASESFPPPPADELIMRGPASLRRRRFVSAAAVLGAATAVTAGGFAVAQSIGSVPKDPSEADAPSAVHGQSSSEHEEHEEHEDPASSEPDDGPAPEQTSDLPGGDDEQVLVVGDWDGVCEGGTFAIDLSDWEFTEDTDWTVEERTAADLDGDDAEESVATLSCGGETAVAAFAHGREGVEQYAWVWQPEEPEQSARVAGVEDGVITLEGGGRALSSWSAAYEWDGETFVQVDDEPSDDPSSSEDPDPTDPGETQPTQGTPTGDGDD